jgi:hypothetical protein
MVDQSASACVNHKHGVAIGTRVGLKILGAPAAAAASGWCRCPAERLPGPGRYSGSALRTYIMTSTLLGRPIPPNHVS